MKKQPKQKVVRPLDPLRLMVRQGQLFGVQDWIREGRPLSDQADHRPSVLTMAVESGFHSMVEVLAAAWPSTKEIDAALVLALEKRRRDMAETLMRLGGDLTRVPLDVIAGTCDKVLMSQVLDRWGDFDQENGLYEIVTSMPRPLTGLLKERRPEIPNNEIQLARAMKQFVLDDHPLWVGLTVWMGGDARLPCPSPDDDEEEQEDWSTPLELAVMLGRYEAVRAMKLSDRDDPTALLAKVHSSFLKNTELVTYLLSRGASPNDKANGGSTVLEMLLSPFFFLRDPAIDIALVEELVECHGAQFRPDDKTNMRDIRRALSSLPLYPLREVLLTLLPAMTEETLLHLINTAKMREALDLKSLSEVRRFVEKLKQRRRLSPPSGR